MEDMQSLHNVQVCIHKLHSNCTLVTQLFSAVHDFQVINMDVNITDLVITHTAFSNMWGGGMRTQRNSPSIVSLLLILQSFDWLAAFHLELLQAILFIAV